MCVCVTVIKKKKNHWTDGSVVCQYKSPVKFFFFNHNATDFTNYPPLVGAHLKLEFKPHSFNGHHCLCSLPPSIGGAAVVMWLHTVGLELTG